MPPRIRVKVAEIGTCMVDEGVRGILPQEDMELSRRSKNKVRVGLRKEEGVFGGDDRMDNRSSLTRRLGKDIAHEDRERGDRGINIHQRWSHQEELEERARERK